ncbi:MAG: transcriptional regulator [Bacteroidetes bacterium]|nr:transcriptional regulator [Bacteroidota bacterium]
MELKEAKAKYIQAWGILGSSWGINKTMGQVHALLMISPEALSTEDIMRELNISRGNANMNIRALIDWGLIFKEFKSGERREYFRSEKDVWELARTVAAQRKQRELAPIIRMLNEARNVKGESSKELDEFKKVTKDLNDFAGKATGILDRFIRSDKNWFTGIFMRLIR